MSRSAVPHHEDDAGPHRTDADPHHLDLGRQPGAVLPSAAGATELVTAGAITATAISALLRAAAAAVAVLLLCSGVALLLWAMTPASGADADGLLQAGVVAFAAAHFMPVSVTGVAVTVRPLLITAIAVAIIVTSAGRARAVHGRMLEALHASIFAIGYAVVVDVAVALLAPAEDASPGLGAPLLVAAVGVVCAVAFHRTAWLRWWQLAVPTWLRGGVHAGLAAICTLLTVGAMALAVALVRSIAEATAVADAVLDSPTDAIGLAVLCLLFVPNAVIASVGYVIGAGFAIGTGSYSPFAVHSVDLPAIPLLAAAPGGPPSTVGYLLLAGPVLAAAVVVWVVTRIVGTRRDRVLAAAIAAAATGLLVAGLAAVAGGGVAGGDWSDSGAPPLLAGGLAAGIVLVLAAVAGAVLGWGRVPWAATGRAEIADGRAPHEDADAPAAADAAPDDGVELGADDAGTEAVLVDDEAPDDGADDPTPHTHQEGPRDD